MDIRKQSTYGSIGSEGKRTANRRNKPARIVSIALVLTLVAATIGTVLYRTRAANVPLNQAQITPQETLLYDACNALGHKLLDAAFNLGKFTPTFQRYVRTLRTTKNWMLNERKNVVVVFPYAKLMANGKEARLKLEDTFYVEAVDTNGKRLPGFVDQYPTDYKLPRFLDDFTVLDTAITDDDNTIVYDLGKSPYSRLFSLIAMSSEVVRDDAMVPNTIAAVLYASSMQQNPSFGQVGSLFMSAGGTWIQGTIEKGATDAAKQSLYRILVTEMGLVTRNDCQGDVEKLMKKIAGKLNKLASAFD